VKVYSVQPGSVDSDINAKGREAVDNPPMDDGECFVPYFAENSNFRSIASHSADFCVWLACPEATFLHGRFVWANWDVDELKAEKEEIERNPLLLTMGLEGIIFFNGTRFQLAMHRPTKCTHKIFIKISYSTSLKIKIAVDKASMEAALHVCNQFLSPNYFKIVVDYRLERTILI
jgi:hypothetical protein